VYTGASVFVYNPAQVGVQPVTPPLTLQQPPITYCVSASRARAASYVYYTDFESTEGWRRVDVVSADTRGSFTSVSGVKGRATQVSDTGPNEGTPRLDYAIYNPAIDLYQAQQQGNTSFWVVVKFQHTSGAFYFAGVDFVTYWAGTYRRSISVGLQAAQAGLQTSTFGFWASNGANLGRDWHLFGSTDAPGTSGTTASVTLAPGTWYVLVVQYNVSIANNVVSFAAKLYDTSSGESWSITGSAPITYGGTVYGVPRYVALAVETYSNYGYSAVFEDFLVVVQPTYTLIDPTKVTVQFDNPLPTPYSVVLTDDTGASTEQSGVQVVTFDVLGDFVLGTGRNGVVEVKFPDGLATCLRYTAPDAILGGDTYTITTGTLSVSSGVNSTSIDVAAHVSSTSSVSSGFIVFSLFNNDIKPYYVRLKLVSASAIPITLTASIVLYNATATTTPQIRVVNGVVESWDTGWLVIQPASRANASFTGYLTAANQFAALPLLLEYCTLPDEKGACVYYPVNIAIYSTG